VDVRLSLVLILFSLVMLLPEALCAQDATHIAKKDGRFALMVEGKPYPMLGAQINNSSAWASSLPEVWPALEGLQVNTMGSARNAALKNASTDHVVYVSPNGTDAADGLSWGTAKLTPQAAFNTATNDGSNQGTILITCGTFPGPTRWYSQLSVNSVCSAPLGNPCGTALCGASADTVFRYSTALTIGTAATQTFNIYLHGIVFDFQNLGGNLTLKNSASFNWDDFAVYRCGGTTTPCVVGAAETGAFNLSFNRFANFYINPISTNAGTYATCLLLEGAGAVNAGNFVTDNVFHDMTCVGNINNGIDFELNSDSNIFYNVRMLNTLGSPASGRSSWLVFNSAVPGTDQDAGNGSFISYLNTTGPQSFGISLGQTSGPYVIAESGSDSFAFPVNILGGTPQWAVKVVAVTAGTTQSDWSSGYSFAKRFGALTGTLLTSSNIGFSTGWGTSPSVATIKGTDSGFLLQITSGSGSPTANPTISVNFTDGAWSHAPVCIPSRSDSSSPAANWAYSFASNTTTGVFAFLGTPAASTTYQLSAICMDKPN
jgi:hypothetical protein